MTKGIWFMVAFIASFALIAGFALATPTGANWTTEITTKTPASDPESHDAYAGNVTFLDMISDVATMSWQGYYGNVTGTIELADSSGNVLYNWSVASPGGEVYASENGTGIISWGDVACFSLAGNHSAVETLFNISTDDVDGINETFSDSTNHAGFYTGSTQFVADSCPAVNVFNSSKKADSGVWEEVMLTDESDDAQVIFASLLEDDVTGFDGQIYDFEMLVLEDGHGAGASSGTTYYFYVELDAS